MTNDTLQTNTVTPEITKAALIVGLSKEGLVYQQLLQDCENVKFTRENLNEERSALINLRKVESKLKAIENPHTAKWKAWNEARKSLVDPVSELLTRKGAEFSKVSREIEAENLKIEQEKQRKKNILVEIDSFFITQSQAIAAATEPSELVRIEKLIGSHKGNSSRYQEFLPTMAEKAEILAQLIKTQKDAIKKIADLRAKEQAAMQSGDDERVLELRDAQEQVTATIEQGKITVQEETLKMATKPEVIEAEVIQMTAPKPSRRLWRYEVVNLKAAEKAGLTKTIIDEEKINARLKEIRESETELTENGIRYFIEKRF